ncbi:MAG: sterol desaturase family protein [Methylococcales bacterium]|jgi:sterol desaturase/sphingolipid hydroxylase (fatty acid hydroxylase superfamily)|nr:sterol desaturase family protein [Methylococcales bacterium]MBT7409575.1 sterol desaturase family protein [Methylococcales bacterium]
MHNFITTHETTIRLAFFIGVFMIVALWEIASPRRTLTESKIVRWFSNLSIVALNTVIVRLLFPAAAVGVSAYVSTHQWGLLNYYNLSTPVAIILAVIALDFIIYLQHVLVHAVPGLWNLHRVHHADLDYDVTTGSRFHPIEIIISMLIKFASIVVLGAPVVAVIIFEVILNACAMFNHGNIYLPQKIDNILRLFIVTPDMHRVHHSNLADETNSNFGFNLPWWDRLFGTYKAQPDKGHIDTTIGITTFTDSKLCSYLPGMLKLPFMGKSTDYTINRRQWKKTE